MTRLTIEQIEAIRERVEKATEGPWYPTQHHVATNPNVSGGYPPSPESICSLADGEYIENYNQADAEFIANARQDIPALLVEVDRLKKKFAHIGEMVEVFYEVDYTDDDGAIIMKVRSDFEKYRCFISKIFVISAEEVYEDGEEI
jgi:hypothetical protein